MTQNQKHSDPIWMSPVSYCNRSRLKRQQCLSLIYLGLVSAHICLYTSFIFNSPMPKLDNLFNFSIEWWATLHLMQFSGVSCDIFFSNLLLAFLFAPQSHYFSLHLYFQVLPQSVFNSRLCCCNDSTLVICGVRYSSLTFNPPNFSWPSTCPPGQSAIPGL